MKPEKDPVAYVKENTANPAVLALMAEVERGRARREARRGSPGKPAIDAAVEALENARNLPEFQRLTAYQQILNSYRNTSKTKE
jgi:hypothetical protein